MVSSCSFSLEYSSSEDELEAQPSRFNIEDLPNIEIPSPFQSDSSEFESPTSPESNVASRPVTPATPLSPCSSIGGDFSFIQLSSQTSDGASGTPKPSRGKKYVKKRSTGYKKGRPPSCPIFESPQTKRYKVGRPKTPMFSDMRFPVPLGTYQIKTVSGEKSSLQDLKVPQGNAICNLEILSLVFSQLNCMDRSCNGRLKLYETLFEDGLQIFFLLKCTHCHRVAAEFPASLPIGVAAVDTINNKSIRVKGKCEINRRALMAVHTTSSSWEDFRLTCSLLDLQVPNKDMSRTQLNTFMEASVSLANRSMKLAGEQAYSHANGVDESPSGLRECSVSFDASWHRRGHYSNQGFAAAIETEFGKVLDYNLYDRNCYSCSKWPESRRSSCPEEFEDYWAKHKTLCTSNYKGSSQSMESTAAIDVWSRSIKTHNLAYGTYIGDGDSSSFKNLLKSDPYHGLIPVRKEECIGHVQKRLKKRLMKKATGSTSLPQRKADRISHLYALVIVQNRGKSAAEIRDALQVLLSHTEELHDHCPPGDTSWCYFQKRKAIHHCEGGPIPTCREPYLTPAEYTRAVEVFATFGSLSFCSTVTLGKTQNSNESLHNMLWHNSPKSKHIGTKSLVASTALAVLSFNDGSLSYSRVMEEMGLTISHNTLKFLSTRDHLRNLEKARRVKETQKRRRRQMTAQSQVAEASRSKRDKKVYSSSQFGSELLGSSDESDSVCEICNDRHCQLLAKSKKDNWIACEACNKWFHWACAGIKSKWSLPEYYFCNKCRT